MEEVQVEYQNTITTNIVTNNVKKCTTNSTPKINIKSLTRTQSIRQSMRASARDIVNVRKNASKAIEETKQKTHKNSRTYLIVRKSKP